MDHNKLLKLQTILTLATLILGVSACKNLPPAGTYRGNFSLKINNGEKESERVPILIELSYAHHQLQAEVFSAENHAPLGGPLVFSKRGENTLALQAPSFMVNPLQPLLLKKVKTSSGQC